MIENINVGLGPVHSHKEDQATLDSLPEVDNLFQGLDSDLGKTKGKGHKGKSVDDSGSEGPFDREQATELAAQAHLLIDSIGENADPQVGSLMGQLQDLLSQLEHRLGAGKSFEAHSRNGKLTSDIIQPMLEILAQLAQLLGAVAEEQGIAPGEPVPEDAAGIEAAADEMTIDLGDDVGFPGESLEGSAGEEQSGEVSSGELKVEGPSTYDSLIIETAQKYNLDPNLVKAVISQESNFDPNAVSGSGCVGLMQLNPATAASLNGGADADLTDPAANVDLGCQYLRQMLDMFNGDVRMALIAYNAGPQAAMDQGASAVPDAQDHSAGTYADLILARL